MALIRVPYDPTTVALTGMFQNKLFAARQDPDDADIVYCQLTAKGNKALLDLCHTNDQKTVWTFPSYEFAVRKNSLTAQQLTTARPSYVNALLIASRGVKQAAFCGNNSLAVFVEQVRLPGYWGGSCAGCKWKDGAASCLFYNKEEAKLVPTSVASLPRTAIEELED